MKKSIPPRDPINQRQQAEEKLRDRKTSSSRALSEADARALVHELQVHQIELEMQNEELQRAQVEAQEAADKYTDLFDFAPVGYFVLDHQGAVQEVNHAGVALLGLDRHRVVGRPFEQYVVPDSRQEFNEFCRRLQSNEAGRSCEIKMLRHNLGPSDVLIEGARVGVDEPGQSPGCRLAVQDITQRRQAENALRSNNVELMRFNKTMVDRELRMIELKKEVNQLLIQVGRAAKYAEEKKTDAPL